MRDMLRERFDVKWIPEPNTGCWLWTAATGARGYGRFWTGTTTTMAHRTSWAIHRGPIPDGAWVLHRCDTPLCVNPEHLFLGDHAANMADSARKGRNRTSRNVGTRNGQARLTEAQARSIRTAAGSQRDIAEQYGVSQSLVALIKHGKVWAHLGDT